MKAESGAQTYKAVHVEGARALARAASAARVSSYVHISGIGADPNSASPYIASKGLGEKATRETFPNAVILRPSVVFGPEDDFFNRFGALACHFLILPLLGGGETRLAAGLCRRRRAGGRRGALRPRRSPATVYELGGPRTMTLREAAELTLRAIDRRRLLIGLPLGPSRWIAASTQFASKATFGLFPKLLTTTRDQVDLLASDNVVSAEAEAEGRALQALGVLPQAAEAIIPSYLTGFAALANMRFNVRIECFGARLGSNAPNRSHRGRFAIDADPHFRALRHGETPGSFRAGDIR